MELTLLGGIGLLIICALALLFLGWIRSGLTKELGIHANFSIGTHDADHPFIDALAGARLHEPVASLRPMGFFADLAPLSDQALAQELHQRIDSRIERLEHLNTDPERPTTWWSIARKYKVVGYKDPAELDLLVIGEDPQRVWWQSLDQVRPGRNAYVEMFERWAAISRGTFQPQSVSESWGAEGEPVIVNFQLAGVQYAFVHLTSHDTHLDTVGLRAFVNPLISASGIQFEIVAFLGIPNIVLALTRAEREHLQNSRGWQFADYPSFVG